MFIIGDVHNKIDEYLELRSRYDQTLQLGDMGPNYLDIPEDPNHVFFKGNHDNHYGQRHPNDLGDFGLVNDKKIRTGSPTFFVRGAESFQERARILDYNWPAEQFNWAESALCLEAYLEAKPSIVISHDCPQMLVPGSSKSSTRQLLQTMWDEWQPDLWVYGHHHVSKNTIKDQTLFVAIGELETYEI